MEKIRKDLTLQLISFGDCTVILLLFECILMISALNMPEEAFVTLTIVNIAF